MALAVVIAPFLSVPLLKEKLDLRQILPVFIVVAGMYFICGGSFSSFGRGELLALLSSLSTSFMLTLSGKFLKDVDAIVLCTIQCAVCFLCCLAAAFLLEGMPVFPQLALPAGGWCCILRSAVRSLLTCSKTLRSCTCRPLSARSPGAQSRCSRPLRRILS